MASECEVAVTSRTAEDKAPAHAALFVRALVKILDCFFLLRFPLLAPVWTIILLGWITGNAHAHLGGYLSNATLSMDQSKLWIALAGFSLVVAAIYVGNQIADIESDRINRKLFLLPHGLVSVPTAWVLAGVCAVAGIFSAFFFDLTMVVLFVSGLMLGIMYDLPPASLKNRPWGGTIACFLGHGMLTFLVGWYAARFEGSPRLDLSGLMIVKWDALLQGCVPALSAGFANAAVFVATTIPDAPGDRAIGKRTFCVAYGEKASACAAVLFCAGALVSSLFLPYNRLVMIVPTALSLPVFAFLVFSTSRSTAFKAFKWPVFALTAGVAVFVPFYAVLILATFFGSKLYYRRRFGIDYPSLKSQ